MTPVLFVAAAATGALIRWLVGFVACSWQALLLVNVAGSAGLGALVAADVSAATLTIAGVGLCGALTTYSSFALEVRTLGVRWGAVYVVATIGGACAAAAMAAVLVNR